MTRAPSSFTLERLLSVFRLGQCRARRRASPSGPPLQHGQETILLYTLAFVAFAVLVYIQFRTWRNFDWAHLWRESRKLGSPPHIYHLFHAVALIYLAYAMRAIRWKIFLRPVRPQAPVEAGRTHTGWFHRPGPAGTPRRTDPPVSDCAPGGFDVFFPAGGLGGGAHLRHRSFHHLLVLAAFFATAPKRLAYHRSFQKAGLIFLALSVGLAIGAIAVSRSGEALANWVERRFAHLASNLGHRVAMRIREFRGGLDTIHDAWSFVMLAVVSMAHVGDDRGRLQGSDPRLSLPRPWKYPRARSSCSWDPAWWAR